MPFFLFRIGEVVGKVTLVTDTLLNVAGIGLDIAELALAQSAEQRITFGVQLGFDTLTFGVGMGAMVAGEVNQLPDLVPQFTLSSIMF